MTNGTITKPASPKQLKWLRDLLIEKDYTTFPADWRDYCDYVKRAFELCVGEGYEPESLNTWLVTGDRDEVTMDTFKTLLPKLQEAPVVKGATPKATMPSDEALPEGRYAIPVQDKDSENDLAFYKVDRPTEGKWAGKVFVKLLLSDNEHRMPFPQQVSVANNIVQYGAAEASMNYGKHFEQCGVCGRGLTNKLSRELGIGPDCRAKHGW